MLSRPDPVPPSRGLRPLLVVLAIVAVVGLGLGVCDVVRAAFQAPPTIKPYDPLPRW